MLNLYPDHCHCHFTMPPRCADTHLLFKCKLPASLLPKISRTSIALSSPKLLMPPSASWIVHVLKYKQMRKGKVHFQEKNSAVGSRDKEITFPGTLFEAPPIVIWYLWSLHSLLLRLLSLFSSLLSQAAKEINHQMPSLLSPLSSQASGRSMILPRRRALWTLCAYTVIQVWSGKGTV